MAWNEPGNNGNKDPWGHRKNEQGPPDLDEILKKIQDKLNSLFGGGSGGSGMGNMGDMGKGLSWSLLAMIAVGLLFLWSMFGWYVVQPAEQGVETRFGRYINTTTQGLNWHFPYPIESVQKVNVEQVRAITHRALMLTQDENIVDIELVVQYRVANARDYLFNVNDPDGTLQQATESSLREVVGTSEMEKVLTSERDKVTLKTKDLIQVIIDRYKTGLVVISVNMQNAQPPTAVQAAFADVIKAREDEERDKNRAQAYANGVLQRATGQSELLRQEAQAYKAVVIARAEGQTQRFLSILTEYEKAPEITRKRLYIETIESVLSNSTKVMVDVKGGNNVMLLPLDKLFAGRTVTTVPTDTTQPAVPSATALPPFTVFPQSSTLQPIERPSRDDNRTTTRGNP
ncbi:FtsH protease activity modulator HflK [Beggiatoa leptomitoformis]|uniref:Protein HflK n=1 Tax=Beggiatoa leptomitoformis TaxID=288004 RepID=A0A2N9YHQ7_9GAMM|nr:FtsH protease activity modulator HflK [Beggiatoa leptomitoformis]ALG67693.1 FtsH protease activity modulator HflK [Beggiatoa leptomitoformis]AUI70068.1 FtsH protease activity modulator HflK [Beggiatoa leptomitoformis]